MDVMKINLLIETLKVLNNTTDYDERESVKRELAKELKVTIVPYSKL